MGCDIHLFGEKKIIKKWWQFWKKNGWVSIDKYSPNPDYGEGKYYDKEKSIILRDDRIYTNGRNYNLFCALAGVRRDYFTDPKIISAPKGVPDDCCEEIKSEVKSWDGDGHSHSWLTLKEMEDFNYEEYGSTVTDFIQEVFPKLRKQSNDHKNVRVVFFFDN